MTGTSESAQARGKYRKVTAFERKIRDALHVAGYAVARGGRKGDPYLFVWVSELKTALRGNRLIFATFYGT